MKSEAQKKSTAKWDKEHLQVVGCRVTREKAALFKKACDDLGTTMNAVLKNAIEQTIKSGNEESN